MRYIEISNDLSIEVKEIRPSYKRWFERFNEKYGHIVLLSEDPSPEEIKRIIEFLEASNNEDKVLIRALKEAVEVYE